jgi:prephenate dehydrogenase
MSIHRITIMGTGLIGSSIGLALRAHGFSGEITGWDKDPAQLKIALERGAIDRAAIDAEKAGVNSDLVLLSGPVFSILDWMERLAPLLSSRQLVTDVGSVKQAIEKCAEGLFGGPSQAGFLPGHPMAGKEVSGAEHAEASLFSNAVWLFTRFPEHPLAEEWRDWVRRMGCRIEVLDSAKHDEICAWVSHLPQMLATALSASLLEHFAQSPELPAIGGRALSEMTRLGSSPYSMWRDIAHANSDAIAQALLAIEQKLAYMRENLRTVELRHEFEEANRFRASSTASPAEEK